MGGEQGGQQVGPGAAHVEREVADQRFGRVQIDGVEKRPALPFDLHKARRCQVGQMMRQRVLLQPQRLGDLGRPHALRRKPHEQAEDGETAGVAERGEGMGGAILFHASGLSELNSLVQ